MKKLFTIILFAFVCNWASAQFNLDKAFTTQVIYFKTYANNDYYAIQLPYSSTTYDNHISIYNASDYTLYKTVTLPASISGYNFGGSCYLFNDGYFDTDAGIEFLAQYKDASGNYRLYLIDEDGTSINGQYMDNAYSAITLNTNAGLKIQTYSATTSSIYNFTVSQPTGTQSNLRVSYNIPSPFPNPVNLNNTITLSYDIADNETGKIIITNTAGVTVKDYNIGGAFKSIIVNTSDLVPGVYNYSVLTNSGTIQGKSFVVE